MIDGVFYILRDRVMINLVFDLLFWVLNLWVVKIEYLDFGKNFVFF